MIPPLPSFRLQYPTRFDEAVEDGLVPPNIPDTSVSDIAVSHTAISSINPSKGVSI
jgi:hypothetical protein